ncbi:DinB family protein [Bacillus pseudomycoides]|uniref:DinB family protein n=1 Tax=Bacillus pseudomycoides TaxID=64104 RepID=UPI000BEBC357|nr:DinB family protein [Bacillus pseudomycoides]PEE41418.1 damage-inducible protein DinB [Bacillus pseudomycoides]PEI92364.1 damage-inducible protein DinB [Bacillus pseudomycoides]PGA94977.1 damage-inducible protein DinB [Bacillus pseudomycoides]PHF41077.1 damage-inducible protein DinB [Bacillus pseudomycoides]
MTHYIIKQFDYHVWANKRIFERLKELPKDVYNQEVQSVFPSIAKALAHIYMVDCVWLNVLIGKSMAEAIQIGEQLQEQVETKTMNELERMFFDIAQQYKVFLGEQKDIDKVIVINNPYAGGLETSVSELVQHVVNHGTYHRGNITAMLRQLGHSATMTDFVLYLHSK